MLIIVKNTEPMIMAKAMRLGWVPIPKRMRWYERRNIPVQKPKRNSKVRIVTNWDKLGMG